MLIRKTQIQPHVQCACFRNVQAPLTKRRRFKTHRRRLSTSLAANTASYESRFLRQLETSCPLHASVDPLAELAVPFLPLTACRHIKPS